MGHVLARAVGSRARKPWAHVLGIRGLGSGRGQRSDRSGLGDRRRRAHHRAAPTSGSTGCRRSGATKRRKWCGATTAGTAGSSNDGAVMLTVGHTATAGWGTPFPAAPPTFDDVPPAAHDPKARLEYMDSIGVWAQVMYPNVGGFGNQAFLALDDPELQLACVRAYNDWLTEWCSTDADRLLAVTATPFWDVRRHRRRDRALRGARPSRDPVHRRAAAVRAAVARRPLVGSAVGASRRRPECRSASTSAAATSPGRSRPSASPRTASRPRT